MTERVDRRRFLRMGLAAGAAAWAGGRLPAVGADTQGEGRPRVVLARDDGLATAPNVADAAAAARVVDAAVARLTGAESASAAWRSLFGPDDVVGIKVNCLAGAELSSHPAIVDAIVAGLRGAGVPAAAIYVWDRTTRELQEAGFTIRRRGGPYRCFGTDEMRDGGYAPDLSIFRSIASRFSLFVSHMCTALINVPVLKDHDIAGLSVGMKNFFGAIDNPNKYHDDNCAPFVADLSAHPAIRGKLRLVVCDALRAQYDGGPSYKPWGAWDYRGLLVARDPVALDATGLGIIERKRAAEGAVPLARAGRAPRYIATAAELGLGTADPAAIDLVEL